MNNLDERQQFLDGMSHAAAAVSVVTTDGSAGRAGVTVSAMSSVSADTPKPMLLICVHHESRAAAAIIENRHFCVNLLRHHQSYISDVFAGRLKPPNGDKFNACEWTNGEGQTPRVKDGLVAFHCHLHQQLQFGTHYVFFGEVLETVVAPTGPALIYANRAYGSPTRLLAKKTHNEDAAPSAKQLKFGCFQTFGPSLVPALLAQLQGQIGPFNLHLVEGDQRRLLEGLESGEIELAMLYDFDLDKDYEAEPIQDLQIYVLLAEQDQLAAKKTLSLSDLYDRPLVLLDVPPSREYFLSLFRTAGLNAHIAFKSSSIEMVRGLVGYGLGYSLLATRPANNQTYDGKTLVCRPLKDQTTPSRLVLAKKRGRQLGSTATLFQALCRKHFEAVG